MVDIRFEALHLTGRDAKGGETCVFTLGCGEIGPQIEELVLDSRQDGVEHNVL